jgi:hypothetical protein
VSTETNEVKKQRGTSLPLLIGLIILGIIGYYAGPTIMTYAFYLQESMIAGSGSHGGDLPVVITPDTSGDPNVGAGPASAGPGPGGPGAGGPGAGGPGAGGPGDGPDTAPSTSTSDAPADSSAK